MEKKITLNVIWNSGSIVLRFCIFIVTVPLIYKYMGEVHYGIYVLSQSIIGPLGFLTISTRPAGIKYMAEDFGKKNLNAVKEIFSNLLGF